jgi:hypothetical protein
MNGWAKFFRYKTESFLKTNGNSKKNSSKLSSENNENFWKTLAFA